MRNCLFVLIAVMTFGPVMAQRVKPVKLNDQWTAKIRELAPAKPTAEPKASRQVLLFSACTGFQHWVIPHTDEVIKALAEKSGAFTIVQSDDVEMFMPEKLKEFDAVILNNNCSQSDKRNLFYDIVVKNLKGLGKKYTKLTAAEKQAKATALLDSLIDYVAKGGGLVGIHGAISIFNSSEKFSEVLGGSFHFHPAQQNITVNLVDAKHPLTMAFKGESFTHCDEPYIFCGAYDKKNFRPLLSMDPAKLKHDKKGKGVPKETCYISWIKKYQKGRVFYTSLSHNAQSFENTVVLQYLLDGIQYALGDLECDDTPVQDK